LSIWRFYILQYEFKRRKRSTYYHFTLLLFLLKFNDYVYCRVANTACPALLYNNRNSIFVLYDVFVIKLCIIIFYYNRSLLVIHWCNQNQTFGGSLNRFVSNRDVGVFWPYIILKALTLSYKVNYCYYTTLTYRKNWNTIILIKSF